ncbi:MAG: hypothetical protein IT285_06595 [Bdellovibrionales bacterium]|nr:hypothetical protein [Bdellovibrionales bacterium]
MTYLLLAVVAGTPARAEAEGDLRRHTLLASGYAIGNRVAVAYDFRLNLGASVRATVFPRPILNGTDPSFSVTFHPLFEAGENQRLELTLGFHSEREAFFWWGGHYRLQPDAGSGLFLSVGLNLLFTDLLPLPLPTLGLGHTF